MGIFGKVVIRKKDAEGQPQKDEKGLGVCIPEARRKIMEKEALEEWLGKEREARIEQRQRTEQLPEFVDEKPRLVAEGIFAVIDTLMVKGRVASGRIEKGMAIKIDGKKFRVKDLQFQGRSAPHLLKGQSGAVFFDKAKGLTFKAGMVLEFRQ